MSANPQFPDTPDIEENIKIVDISMTHQGGAWKVAYADFVTAMMAFFLLLWLLNVTTDEQKNAISDFFDPTHPKVSNSTSGAGGVMGGLSVATEGSMTSNRQELSSRTGRTPGNTVKTVAQIRQERIKNQVKKVLERQEEEKFENAAEQIKQSVQEDPNLSELADNIVVDMTPEGLRIQIVDRENRPMFASGSAEMFAYMRALLGKIATVIQDMPNELSIRGHTDSVPYGPNATYTNWELSTDRANSSRRAFEEEGITEERFNNVIGKADTEHLLPDEPTNPRNRRISIVLLKESLTNENYDENAENLAEDDAFLEENKLGNYADRNAPKAPPAGTFRRTPGEVEFP